MTSSPRETEPLVREIRERVQELPGRAGVYARHLDRGLEVDVDADVARPTASGAKVLVLIAFAEALASGRLDGKHRVRLSERHHVLGSGVLRYCAPGLEPTLSDLAHLMITVSDNVATNLLLEALGGPQAVNAELARLGLAGARILEPLRFEGHRVRFAEASARGLAEAYAAIAQPERSSLSPEAAASALAVLRRCEDSECLPRHLPWIHHAADFGVELPVRVHHKTGSFPGVRVDAGLFETARGRWVAAVMCEELTDLRPHSPGAGATLCAEVGRLLYEAWG